MKTKVWLILGLAVSVPLSVAQAHDGVKNRAVMARMQAMSAIAAEAKTMGLMAKGQSAFDAASAQAAAKVIAEEAARIPDLFADAATDPKSEALPAIWENPDAFADLAKALENVAGEAAESMTSRQDLQAAMQRIGAACQACHQDYKKK